MDTGKAYFGSTASGTTLKPKYSLLKKNTSEINLFFVVYVVDICSHVLIHPMYSWCAHLTKQASPASVPLFSLEKLR